MGEQNRFEIKYQDVWLKVKCEVSNSISEYVGLQPRYDGGWGIGVANMQGYNIILSGIYNYSKPIISQISPLNNIGLRQITAIKRNKTLIEWRVKNGENIIIFGKAYISDVTINRSAGEFVTFDANMQGFGVLETIDNSKLIGVLASYECDILINNNGESIKVSDYGG